LLSVGSAFGENLSYFAMVGLMSEWVGLSCEPTDES
jgi:hypothetical protein